MTLITVSEKLQSKKSLSIIIIIEKSYNKATSFLLSKIKVSILFYFNCFFTFIISLVLEMKIFHKIKSFFFAKHFSAKINIIKRWNKNREKISHEALQINDGVRYRLFRNMQSFIMYFKLCNYFKRMILFLLLILCEWFFIKIWLYQVN